MFRGYASNPVSGRGGMMMMGPRGGHGFHPYGPPRGAMMGGQRGAFASYPGAGSQHSSKSAYVEFPGSNDASDPRPQASSVTPS